jgi:hypothetical protein
MIEQTLDIATKDGAMETFICRPDRGEGARFSGILIGKAKGRS